MSTDNISWFHCGRCGSLFLSPAGESDERFCPSCGCNPSLGVEADPPEPLPSPDSPTFLPEPIEKSGGRAKSSLRKKKQSHLMVKLVVAWTTLLVAIVFIAQRVWMDDSERPPEQGTLPSGQVPSAEDIAFLRDVAPLCNETLSGFLTADSPEQRNQFVSSPITTAGRMARFYSMNPFDKIEPEKVSPRGTSIVNLPGGKAMEIQLTSSDGHLLDAVFVNENEDWKIDWYHYARHSDSPWALFLADSGEAEGEFRLLARERLADERKEEDHISMVLYAPRFGYAADTGFQSPEFLVKRDSRDGRLLEAAFELERAGKRVFGNRLPSIDPEGLIRVRVRIRRFESDMKRHFEITDVVACHWYSVDDPGVEIKTSEANASSPQAAPSPETSDGTPAPPGG